MMYDEAWTLMHRLAGIVAATTDNAPNFDMVSWHVDPELAEGGDSPDNSQDSNSSINSRNLKNKPN
jgi:hypothetical protein